MYSITHLSEGWRIFRRSGKVKRLGTKQYTGDAEEICRQIIEDCWNGSYFQVSTGHFCEFYIRDFGWCADSLLKLGYREEVLKTLDYALSIYSKQRLTTTITPSGKCIDIFYYSPDSLAFLIRCLRAANAKWLVKKYRDFLIKEIIKFEEAVIDKRTGMVKSEKRFSSIKDHSKRRSSTYNNIMAAMLSNEIDKLKLPNPLKKYRIKENIIKNLWNGEYFLDEIGGTKAVTGDSNIFPFWTGVFNDRKMLKSCTEYIRKAHLDTPFPLKYSSAYIKEQEMRSVEFFAPHYERDSIWMHMGPLYIQILKRVDKNLAKEYCYAYTKLIEKHKNFLEVFDSQGNPYNTPFYHTDEGMLWAANYLTLF